jgi:hypothetical protein
MVIDKRAEGSGVGNEGVYYKMCSKHIVTLNRQAGFMDLTSYTCLAEN